MPCKAPKPPLLGIVACLDDHYARSLRLSGREGGDHARLSETARKSLIFPGESSIAHFSWL